MAEREVLEVDVLIVGGGPAGLSCAIRLADAFKDQLEKPSILLMEKGISIGAHELSGAVLDPRALTELLPDWQADPGPVRQAVKREEIWFLTAGGKLRLPKLLHPPYLQNHGNFIISIGEFTPWLAEHARHRGVEILEGLAGAELLIEEQRVLGVRCRDTGVQKDGTPGPAFAAGADIRARVTVLAEGPRGSLTKQLIKCFKLEGRHPQTYATGVKELWELPAGRLPAGTVIHSLGHPLQGGPLSGFAGCFGGGFLYGLDDTHAAIGLVVGLDYEQAALDPQHEFNRFKEHPAMRALLKDGKAVAYGAKTIPEGGFYSLPTCHGDGFLICGDSASFLNAARLKGIHLAMKSGVLAAETIAAALKTERGPLPDSALKNFDALFAASWAHAELKGVRNWRAGFARGLVAGTFHDLAQRISGGRGFSDPLPVKADFQTLKKIGSVPAPNYPASDGHLTLDKVSDVFLSGTNHAENQPCHLIVPDPKLCVERCSVEYGNPCQHFCPAAVYEWIGAGQAGHLRINAGNCVHCKTCDIKDPYENIEWVVPEGGGGPRYNRL